MKRLKLSLHNSLFIWFRKMLVSRAIMNLSESMCIALYTIILLLNVVVNCSAMNDIKVNDNFVSSTTPVINSQSNVVLDKFDRYINKTTKATIKNNYHNYNNKTTSKMPPIGTGNILWDGIIRDCYEKPSVSCFQKNVFEYLDGVLETADVNITNRLSFFKNQVDYTKYSYKENIKQSENKFNGNNYDEPIEENEIPNEARADSPIEEVTNAMYGKSVKFVMTHDVELKLPEMVFDGATFRISPRSIEGNGAIVKLELIPKREIEARSSGRLLKKKFHQFFKNKMMLSFFALLLIIKFIKIKFFWLLPLVVGVSTAKKLLLKFLLFLFPALSHLFKLCSYYQQNYHSTKYHTHHHHINHHHTVAPAWFNEHGAPGPNVPEIIYTHPPKVPPSVFLHGNAPIHEHYEQSWENSGPGLGSEYIGDIHRNSNVEGNYFKPKTEDGNELNTWGLGTTNGPQTQKHTTSHSHNINPFLQDAQNLVTTKLQKAHGPVYVPPRPTISHGAAQIAAQYDPMAKTNIHQSEAQIKEALRIEAEQRIVAQQQKILNQQPFVQDGEPLTPKNYDSFYSPILEKIDKIVQQLGVTDNNCKERLICSMYKSPTRYSPHSNFVSAELSRDTSELQQPSSTNESVLRFYRLVQAARDGQEQRDCLRLYPQCSILTE